MWRTIMRKSFVATLTLVSIIGLMNVAGLAAQAPDGQRDAQAIIGTGFTYQGRLVLGGTPVDDTCDFRFIVYDAAVGGSQVGGIVTQPGAPVSAGLFSVSLDFGAGVFTGDARWLEIAVRCPAGGGGYTSLSPRQALTAAPYALALPGLWTQPNASSPNLIGGYNGNSVVGGAVGATIGGGGSSTSKNWVTDGYGVVGGGLDNRAGDAAGTVDDASAATVGGGQGNVASGLGATVGGGTNNEASDFEATVGGGSLTTPAHGERRWLAERLTKPVAGLPRLPAALVTLPAVRAPPWVAVTTTPLTAIRPWWAGVASIRRVTWLRPSAAA
jgi:hypothetical protein